MLAGVGEAGQELGAQAPAQEGAAGLRAAPEQDPAVQAFPGEGRLRASTDNTDTT